MKKLSMLLVVAILLVALGGCELLGSKEIIYQVQHSVLFGSVDIRYEDEEGELVTVYNATSPWSHSFTVNRAAAAILVYLSAENNEILGDVTVRILEDGSVVAEDTGVGGGSTVEVWAIIE
jgi:hypothetical protein